MEIEDVSCNLCGADDTKPWGSKDGFHIVQCRKCGLVYINPRPTRGELTRFYTNPYFDEGNYAADPLRLDMYKIEIEQMVKIMGGTGRFLDVGCALGMFLKSLPDTFEKYGIEFSEEAAKYGREHFGLNIRSGQLHENTFPKGFFDVVHMRGVIEHLQDPTRDLMAAHRILKENGWLIVSTTPNISSPCGKLYKEDFRLVIPIEHLYYFSPSTLKAMLKKAGFRPMMTFYPYWGIPYANPLRDVKDFFLNMLLGKNSPPFWRSVMTMYAKKELTS